MVTQPASRAEAPRHHEAEPATARWLRRMHGRAAAVIVVALVTRAGVVVAQPEEPDKPEHEQADVENSEADHEDPALRTHMLIVPPLRRRSYGYLLSRVFGTMSAVNRSRAVVWTHL